MNCSFSMPFPLRHLASAILVAVVSLVPLAAAEPVKPFAASPAPTASSAALIQANPESPVELDAWSKPVRHIFFHPLVSRPEVAYKPGKWMSHMYEWFITTTEFRRLLDQLYERKYVLVDFYDTVSQNPDGTWAFKPVLVPKGRIPLLLSIDDLNYYAEMRWNGTASRLELDDAGKLRTRTFASSQVSVKGGKKDTTSYDNDIPLILEEFILAHPDFSWKGGRGIIAVTGKRGLFGWPTQKLGAPDFAEALAGAKAVADRLKTMGWRFASHSYFHMHRKDQTPEAFDQAERQWMSEVGSIIGETSLYIYPYGEPLMNNEGKKKTLLDLGFKIFFTVENAPIQSEKDGLLTIGRIPMDGRALDGKFGQMSLFCDRKTVRDDTRPAPPSPDM